ncbi:cation diffusion facilitator family transporter [Sphingopyxis sp.]|uniref:cation diffusion facilitator family transporter n=1 Tax=Sphingopyxis sp. TaxID=1908224 RepID=UPI002EDAD209
MGQDHSHDHVAGANTRMLGWALALTATFLVVEVAGGLYFNSLALLSDAGHMLTDVAALAIALLAIKLGAKPPDDRRSFGYRRVEILAAVFNALMLFAIAIYVFVEAVERFRDPQPVQSWGMMAVAAVGLVVNLIAMRMLAAGKEASFNVKGAYLEVWADMIGSVGVILGAIAIRFTGWTWVDPVVAVLIGLWVLPRTWILLRGTINVLLEGVPDGVDLVEVRAAVKGVSGVAELQRLQVWSISNRDNQAVVHILASPRADIAVLQRGVAEMLHDRFDIAASTVQVEPAPLKA